MRPGSFQTKYRDSRVRRPDFSLAEAIGWFLADKPTRGDGVVQTTICTYRSWLNGFHDWLPEDARVLASLEPETVQRYVRIGKSPNTRMNMVVALKSFATYLAEEKIWYAGTKEQRVSVLRECKTPRPSDKGQPPYQPDQIALIERNLGDGLTPIRNRAVIAVLRHGFRAKEARLLVLRNVVLPAAKGSMGHFIIETEGGTKKGSGGVRIVPMSDHTKRAIAEYIRHERPPYRGGYKPLRAGETVEACAEPLFLTYDGYAIRHAGWHQMARRFRAMLKATGVSFRQHRHRGTRARELHEAGWTDTDIMEALGWKTLAMLRRYIGRVSIAHLKRLPEPMDRAS